MDVKVINIKRAESGVNVLTLDRHSSFVNGKRWEEVCFMVDLRENGRLIGRTAELDYADALKVYTRMLEADRYSGYSFKEVSL